jgi:plastocyanin
MTRALTALLACSALVLVAGCGSSGSSSSTGASNAGIAAPPTKNPKSSRPPRTGTVNVTYQNIAISPANITVKVGAKIKWTNRDSTAHNVSSDTGPAQIMSKDFSQGGTFTYAAQTVGVIHYVCSIHPSSMVGTITVVK